jgi:hypothetical protein
MSRRRQLLLHALLAGGFGIGGLVFVGESSTATSTPAAWLYYAAGIATLIVAVAFVVRFAMVLRSQPSPSPISDALPSSGDSFRDWRVWGLAAWLAVCISAFVAEVVGRGVDDLGRLRSPLSTILLVGLLAMQAFRMVIADRTPRNP